MGKNAVYRPLQFYHFNDNRELKRLCILFDKVYVNKGAIPLFTPSESKVIDQHNETIKAIHQEIETFQWLKEKGVVIDYEESRLMTAESITDQEVRYVKEYLDDLKQKAIQNDQFQLLAPSELTESLKRIYTIQDIHSRIDAVELSRIHGSDFIPILNAQISMTEKGIKNEVVHFLLQNIPEPEENNPWVFIIDFRKDEETKLKNLTLIDWINEISKSHLSMGEIKDKYEYLYLDYKRSYERHKLKSTFSVLEIIIAAGTAFFTGDTSTAINLTSSFLKVRSSILNLMKEESSLPGKEVAYIYHAKKQFEG